VMLACLHFVGCTAHLFEPVLTKLQTESSVIHLLLEELAQLLRLLLHRFIKPDLLTGVTDAQLVDVPIECRPVDNCEFGAKTDELLRRLKKNKNPKLAMLQKDMVHCLKSCVKYLQQRLPLKNQFLHNVQCLKPASRNNAETVKMIGALCTCLPQLSDEVGFSDSVSSDWKLYQADDNITPDWATSADGSTLPVDIYVSKQTDGLGNPKYSHLMAVVKAALSVSHGQADVERGFSLNKLIIVDNRVSLKQRTVMALCTVRDVVNRYEAVDKIPISRQLIRQY